MTTGSARRALAVAAIAITGSLAAVAPALAATHPPASGPAVPSDPNASGAIGLCSASGQQITSGSITTAPFVTRAVASTPAPAGYGGAGKAATLYAFQPRSEVPSGEWSGSMLTATTSYSNASWPTAVATSADSSLQSFLVAFPPENGLVELRLYLSAPGKEASSLTYPATMLQVSGDTWHVVGTAPKVDCQGSKAESSESVLLPRKDLRGHHPRRGSLGSTGGTATGTSSANASSGSSTKTAGHGHAAAGAATNGGGSASGLPGTTNAADSSTSGSSDTTVIVVAAIAGFVAIGACATWLTRRRPTDAQPHPVSTSTPSALVDAKKGL